MLHYIDIIILALYFVITFILGFVYRSPKDTSSYVLMGRRLTLAPFVMTLVSTWYGGILGVSEFSYSYGLSNWVIFGLPYYCFGILFAVLVAKRAHRLNVSSLPEIMGRDYGPRAGIIASFWVMVLASPAPYILTLGLLLNYFLGVSLLPALILGGLFSLLYILKGGLGSVVKTDVLQFVLMFAGFSVLLIILMVKHGSPLELWNNLPQSHTSLTGGNSIGYILVWFFIGSWTLVDPGFHQRVYAAKSAHIAKRGVLIAVGFWFIFDMMTTLTGLYAFSLLPASTNPSQAFLLLGGQILPPGLAGLFFVGILATVMSTLDSNTLVSGISLGRDICGNIPFFKRWETTLRIKISMGFIMVLGILLAWQVPSVVDLWYTFGTISIPALLFPTLLSVLNKPGAPRAVVASLILSPLASVAWFLFAKVDEWTYFWGIEPFFPGILMSFSILFFSSKFKKEL